MERYLVIANETVGGDELVEEVRRRAGAGQIAVHVLVPSAEAPETSGGQSAAVAGGGVTSTASFGDPGHTHGSETSGTTGARPGDATDLGGSARLGPHEQARVVLQHVVGRVERVAQEVTGEVGPPDLVEGARAALAAGRYDGIILATPSAGASTLVGQDLPHKLSRAVDVPVTTVHAPRTDPAQLE